MTAERSLRTGPSARRFRRLVAICALLLGLTMVAVPCVLMAVGTIVETVAPGA